MLNNIKKGDIIALVIIAGLIAASFASVRINTLVKSSSGRVAVIRQNNVIIRKIDLDKSKGSQEIQVDGDYHNTVLVENGRIRFEKADCPDLVCVKTGWLDKNGQMAVCLPNKVSIKIEGSEEGLDGVAF